MEESHAKSGKNLQVWLKITFKYLGRIRSSKKKATDSANSQFAKFLLKTINLLPAMCQ